jgi:hypothetical protein
MHLCTGDHVETMDMVPEIFEAGHAADFATAARVQECPAQGQLFQLNMSASKPPAFDQVIVDGNQPENQSPQSAFVSRAPRQKGTFTGEKNTYSLHTYKN